MADATSTPGVATLPPIHLDLHGVNDDRARLNRLATRLRRLGIACSVTLWRPDRQVVARTTDPNNRRSPEGQLQSTICWTRRSIASEQKALHEFAIRCKANGSYLGLILDDVGPPQTVTGADDIKLVGWDWTAGGSTVAPLLDFLHIRRAYQAGALAALLRPVREVWAAITDLYDRVKRSTVVSLIGILIAIFSFLGAFVSNTSGMCQLWGIRAFCGWTGIGNVPTAAQTEEWQKVEKTRDCSVLERYLDTNGHNSPFADAAKDRIRLKRYVDGPRAVPTQIEITYWLQPFASSRKAALDALEGNAKLEAHGACESQSKAFLGIAGPEQYVAKTAPQCVQEHEGFRCGYRIEVTCHFLAKDELLICPP